MRTDRRAILVGLLTGVLLAAGAARADDRAERALDAWLAERGLHALSADLLERRLAVATDAERPDLAERLARLYATLLDRAEDPALIDRYAARGRVILQMAPPNEASELRLSLARTAFRRTERAAERSRLRYEGADDPVIAARRFGDLLAEFDDIADRAGQRVRALERQRRAGSADDRLLDRALGEAQRERSLASYLAGWSAAYLADLGDRPDAADLGLVRLGRLLGARDGARPELERVGDQTLRYPHVARAALATAICLSVRGSPERAMQWLDRLRSIPELPEGVAPQIDATELIVLARASRWGEILDAEERRAEADDAGPSRARLLAVLALDAIAGGRDSPSVRLARDRALSRLAAGGHVGDIIELARHYGASSFGADTFVSMHVRALVTYDRARAAHLATGEDPDEPTADAEVARVYLEAAELLAGAIGRGDALDRPGALASASTLIGLCRFYAGEHDGATARFFVDAADRAPDPARAANALWMAIHALDRAIERSGDPDGGLERRHVALVDRFLREHPRHERAATLVLRRAIGPATPDARAVELLLSIPPESPLHETAQRHAARRAYALARGGTESDREFRRLQYLTIATPLLASDRRAAASGDADAAARAGVRARQIAEIALARSVPDVRRAELALDALASLVSSGLVDGGSIAAELDLRRAQIATARGDHALAAELYARAADADPALALPAAQAAYQQALDRARAARGEGGGAPRLPLARLVESGERLLRSLAADGRGLDDAATLTVLARTADAATRLAMDHGDSDAALVALALYDRWLAHGAPSGEALRNVALVAGALGERDRALDAWRRLAAALPPGTERWFEARVGLLETLERTDPGRAREALRQQLVLYPDPAPPPWQRRLVELSRRLGVAPERGRGGP
jgi:hypothetical protein